ncbi:MAG: hypothetical protein IKJ22_01425 [Paludibacteraceae bacterium]|nr:hypothetical protein [Paludibacteraceae bacterium]
MNFNLIFKLYKLSFKRVILEIQENKLAIASTIFMYLIMIGVLAGLLISLSDEISRLRDSIIGRNDTHLIINASLISLFSLDFSIKLFGKGHKGFNVYSFLTLPVRKAVLVDIVFIKECFSLYNLILPCLFLPFLLVYPYAIDKIVCYMFFLYTISACNTIIARIFRLGRKRSYIYYLYIVLYFLLPVLLIPIVLLFSYAVLFKANIYFYALLGVFILCVLHRIFRKTCIRDFYYIDE